MNALYMLLFFVFGTVLGSFYNVVGLRLPKNISFAKGRSYCPNCKKTLFWYELIPVISYISQGGKCRNCNSKISLLYPSIELLTGILFAFSFYKIGFDIELVMAISLISMLIIVFVTDLSYMVIPNKVLLFFLPLFIIIRIINPLNPWWTSISGAVFAFLLIAIIIIVSKGGMGAGDMKLFGVLGLVLGFKNVLLTFFLASLIGTIIGGFQRLTKQIEKGQAIPFGPSIVIATIITYFYGSRIVDWYLQLL